MKHSGADQILSTVDVYLKRRQFIVSKFCFLSMICLFEVNRTSIALNCDRYRNAGVMCCWVNCGQMCRVVHVLITVSAPR